MIPYLFQGTLGIKDLNMFVHLVYDIDIAILIDSHTMRIP